MLKRWWEHSLKPDAHYGSVLEVPLDNYYKNGYRLILLDIDNTLMPHGRHDASEMARDILAEVRRSGLTPVILSNAKKERAAAVAKDLGCPVIGMAMKPSPKGVERALRQTGYVKEQTLLVGDQIFTDIWAGRRAGVHSILVDPVDPSREPIQIALKRRLERSFKTRYGLPMTGASKGASQGAGKGASLKDL